MDSLLLLIIFALAVALAALGGVLLEVYDAYRKPEPGRRRPGA
jgi:hypothetical protein